MSRHYIALQYKNFPVHVILGYDRPLDEFFMQVVRQDAENVGDDESHIVYATIDDPECDGVDFDFCRARLQELNLSIPESMFDAVLDDAANQVGNYVVEHFADGRTSVKLPKEVRR